MIKWCSTYYNNYIENYLFKMLHKYCSGQIDDLCVLDTTSDPYWVDFYINIVQAPLVTSLGSDSYCDKAFLDNHNYDYLKKPLYDNIGPFINQYNVIHVLDSLIYEFDDNKWRRSLENLCSYLKPSGFMIISGNLQVSTTDATVRHRSEGLWRAIIHNSGCTIKHFTKMPISVFTDIPHDILIVGKK